MEWESYLPMDERVAQAKASATSATSARRTRPIVVMLSSKSKSQFDGKPLAVHRDRLRLAIESEKLLDAELFEVWTNESAPAAPATVSWWEHCVTQAREADVLLAIYNGDAGSQIPSAGGIGICHAEFLGAVETGPERVRVITLANPSVTTDADRLFAQDLARYELFSAHGVSDAAQLDNAVLKALLDAVRTLIATGRGSLRRGRRYAGSALEWTRLSMRERRRAMRDEVVRALGDSPVSDESAQPLVTRIAGTPLLVVCDAVPGPMSVAAARELVGQPFLRDHVHNSLLAPGTVGPVHFIACQRAVTEAQALRQLGHPDAVVVRPPFGVYVADDVSKVQMIFLADCHDAGNTRARVQEALAWLERANETQLMLRRAEGRAEIVRTIARFQGAGPSTPTAVGLTAPKPPAKGTRKRVSRAK